MHRDLSEIPLLFESRSIVSKSFYKSFTVAHQGKDHPFQTRWTYVYKCPLFCVECFFRDYSSTEHRSPHSDDWRHSGRREAPNHVLQWQDLQVECRWHPGRITQQFCGADLPAIRHPRQFVSLWASVTGTIPASWPNRGSACWLLAEQALHESDFDARGQSCRKCTKYQCKLVLQR